MVNLLTFFITHVIKYYMSDISDIVRKYLRRKTLREFAKELSEGTGKKLSHASVINWRDGKTIPATDLLCLLVLRHKDWRRDFALECLEKKYPTIWGEDGFGAGPMLRK